MTVAETVKILEYCEPLFCLGALAAICFSRSLKNYGFLAGLLASRVFFIAAQWIILTHWQMFPNARVAYQYDFAVYGQALP